MEMRIYAKASNVILRDDPDFIHKVLNRTFKSKRKRMKGVKVFTKGSPEIGYDGDDFAKDVVTIYQLYDVYKKPRFIK